MSRQIHNSDRKKRTTVNCIEVYINAIIAEKLKKEFIAFDTETTGLDPKKDRIIEISAVRFKNGVATDKFSTFINANVFISENITNINHITNEIIAKAPTEYEAYDKFISFLGNGLYGDIILCAHNANFDFSFLKNTFKRLGITANIKYVDTLAFCRQYISGVKNYKQRTLEKYFRITNKQPHTAGNDAEACGRVLMEALQFCEERYRKEKITIEKSTPSNDELEICAIIHKMIFESGFDTTYLCFRKTSSKIEGICLLPFVSFNFLKKGRYIILPKDIAEKGNLLTFACSISEGGTENRRVFFTSPTDLEQFTSYIVKMCKSTYRRAIECSFYDLRAYMSGWYRFGRDELARILHQINQKDYSGIPIPTPERIITRKDVEINPINSRVPLEKIKNLNNWHKGFDEGYKYWKNGDMLKKKGNYLEAIKLFDKSRYYGYSSIVLYESYAMAFHKLKDFENEIDILDEGLKREVSEIYKGRLESRRDIAIKSLFKLQKAERIKRKKSEIKK